MTQIIIISAIAGIAVTLFLAFVGERIVAREQKSIPLLHDAGLAVELVAEGLESPTSMAFLGDGSILALQKDDGQVRHVVDEELYEEPVLIVSVANEAERGLLGIANWQGENDTSVFLYLTDKDGDKIRNRVYKYDWSNDALSNKTLILDLPGEPGPYHNWGKIAIGPGDGYLHAVIDDVNAGGGMLGNQIPGRPLDYKSLVLRVNRDTGMPAEVSPIIIGEDFGRITDIETGTDGHLYILSYEEGKIYMIVVDGKD